MTENHTLLDHEKALKRLADGNMTFRTALTHTALQSLTVARVLDELHGGGPARTAQISQRAGVATWLFLRELTGSQRLRLTSEVERRGDLEVRAPKDAA